MRRADKIAIRGSWLGEELARQFHPVAAPDSLWQTIHEQRRPLRSRPQQYPVWLSVAGVLVFGCAALATQVVLKRQRALDLRGLSQHEVRGITEGPGAMDFRSTDASEIRT